MELGTYWYSANVFSKAMCVRSLQRSMMTKTNAAAVSHAMTRSPAWYCASSKLAHQGIRQMEQRESTKHGIMSKPLQPTLKRSAEISLTTGRSLSPEYVHQFSEPLFPTLVLVDNFVRKRHTNLYSIIVLLNIVFLNVLMSYIYFNS